MQRCEQMTHGSYQVPSDSQARKFYTVTAFGGVPPTCTCVAFAIGRNRTKSTKSSSKQGEAWCKHIEYIFDTTCQWDSGSDIVQTQPGVCPSCGTLTVWDDDDGEVTEVASETAVSSLQDMIAEIESKINE